MINLAKSSKNMPQARTEDLSITVSESETLVYDAARFVIHRLSAEVATIWRLADGSRDVAQLATDASIELGSRVSARSVEPILENLSSMGLLQDTFTAGSRISRRLFAGAAGVAAASTFIPASANTQEGLTQEDPISGLSVQTTGEDDSFAGDSGIEQNVIVDTEDPDPEDPEPAIVDDEPDDTGTEPDVDTEEPEVEIPNDGEGN